MDIPSISEIYTEAHNVSHARTRLQGDENINHVLDHAVQRESNYTRTRGTNLQAEQIFQATLLLNTVGGDVPSYTALGSRPTSSSTPSTLASGSRSGTPPGTSSRKG